jgi:putative membrane-bound dehydrogenase-like protein
MSSSVCVVLNEADPLLPPSLVRDGQSRSRFSRYLPFRNFVNKVFNYPYPFVVAGAIWEFPIGVPDDWQGQNLQKPNNPQTLEDMQAYLDAVILKRGVANVVFHPHGWIRNDQIVALVDHAVRKHGRTVKFLTFKECLERLNEHLLAGQSLRAADGGDNGVRIFDVNNDGYMDVLIGNDTMQRTRIWNPERQRWIDSELPVRFVIGDGDNRRVQQVRFGVIDTSGSPILLVHNDKVKGAWRFDGDQWIADVRLWTGLEIDGDPVLTGAAGRDLGVRMRDLNADGVCELLIASPKSTAAFHWDIDKRSWQRHSFALPEGVWIVDAEGRDGGARFADFDGDLQADVLYSSERGAGLFLFDSMKTGWTRRVFTAAGDRDGLPLFARSGSNGGGWIVNREVWFQNEETVKLPDGVFRRSFNELLGERDLPPLSPLAGLKSLHTSPGYRVELVAAEPLVMDPVAFDWGPDGKLWVAEMADYPLGIDNRGKVGGRIRFLEDSDDDGKYDRSKVFLDEVGFPTGVMAWRDGVLVTAAPDVFFARDTNGDGKCDERVVLFEGFSPGNQQHRVNGLRWSIDGWVHLANGDSGGKIRATGNRPPSAPSVGSQSEKEAPMVDMSQRDLRIKPDEGRLETVTGMTQFGRNRDDAGHWFGTNNPRPLYQFVLDDRYLRRNPHVAPPPSSTLVVDPTVQLYPLSRTFKRFNDPRGANHFTSASSGMVYRDSLLPNMAGHVIACEPVHNLVHREALSRKGLLFSAQRVVGEEEAHLLRSTDNWFRPVMARTGPDGAIWIADMYRKVIEHPEWIPDDVEATFDLRAGHDKGRIYRIVPANGQRRPTPRLDQLSTRELVARLENPNGTERDRAEQILIWRGDKSAVKPLVAIARRGSSDAARAQALWTIALLDALDQELLVTALDDASATVRVQAIRLAEKQLNDSSQLGEGVLALLDDQDVDVQLQLAYTLGEWNDPRAADALGRLVVRHRNDEYLLAAVLSSVNRHNLAPTLDAALADGEPAANCVERLMSIALGHDDRALVERAVRRLAASKARDGGLQTWQIQIFSSLLASLRRTQKSVEQALSPESRQILDHTLLAALEIASDESKPVVERIAAMRLLAQWPQFDAVLPAFEKLIAPRETAELQQAAINALAQAADDGAARLLLDAWDAFTPPQRAQVLGALISRKKWVTMLVERMEQGGVPASAIDAARRQQLSQIGSDELKGRVAKLFSEGTSARQEIVNRYQSVLSIPGDRQRGREVFVKRCTACHMLEGKGHAVGADLTSLSNKSPAAQLIAILDPNRAVEDKFVTYVALLDDGRQLTGILAGESGESLRLKMQDGTEQVVLRKELDALKNTGQSLMPEGLEKDMSEQEIADVIAYVGGFSMPPK